MKKIYLTALFLISISFNAHSQNKITLAIEAGPNLTSFYGNRVANKNKARNGFTLGIAFTRNLTKNISLHIPVLLESSQAKINFIYGGESVVFDTHTRYLTLPLLIRFHTKLKRPFNFYFNTGPFIGYLITNYQNIEYPDGKVIYRDLLDSYRHFNTGISGGVGINYKLPNNIGFSFELQENLGLFNTGGENVVDNASIKTNTVSALLGINYHF